MCKKISKYLLDVYKRQELARTVIEAALDDVGCPYEAEVNLLLTMNEQIHEMNLERCV